MSSEGKMCIWSLGKMTQPQRSIKLFINQTAKNIDMQSSILCMDFPADDLETFYVGGENGNLYSGCAYSNSKEGITQKYVGHTSPITHIACHQKMENSENSDLLLTSSMDWSVKLWNKQNQNCILSFEDYDDAVYDVRWSPKHPYLFASVDSSGKLVFWDISKDTEIPMCSVEASKTPLSCLRWTPDGTKVVTGSLEGTIQLFNVEEEISIPTNFDKPKWQQWVQS